MSSTVLNISDHWSAGGRYLAIGDTEVLLSYPDDVHDSKRLRFVTTFSDAAASIPVDQGHPLSPLENRTLQLRNGERLWVAGYPGAVVIITALPRQEAAQTRIASYPNQLSVGTSDAPAAPFSDVTESHLLQDGHEHADMRGGWFHDAVYNGLLARQFPSTTRASGNIPAANGNGVSWRVSFFVDGDFSIRLDGGDNLLTRYRVWINGVEHFPVNVTGVGGGRRWWSFKLPKDQANRVVVEGYGDVRWYGFKTEPGAVVNASLAKWRSIVFGDSFTSGTGASAQWNGWANLLRPQEEFGIAASGSGGTGYVNDLGGAQQALPARIVADYNRISADTGVPNEVIIAMGLNDMGSAGIETAAAATFDALRTVYNGPVFVLGPWDTVAPAAPSSDWVAARDAIIAAVGVRAGFSFLDMQGVSFTTSDGTHPDDAGHRVLAENLRNRLADTSAVASAPLG